MTLQISPEILDDLVQPVLAIREDGECRLDVTPGRLRLRFFSMNKRTYVDLRIPLSATPQISADQTETVWLNMERIDDLLAIINSNHINIMFPPEGSSEKFVIWTDACQHRFLALDPITTHSVESVSVGDLITSFEFSQYHLARTVTAAGLVGETMDIHIEPDSEQIKFYGGSDELTQWFEHTTTSNRIDFAPTASVRTSTSITNLQKILPVITGPSTAEVTVSSKSLGYHADYPVSGAKLSIYTRSVTQA
jgi:hypothetical protein